MELSSITKEKVKIQEVGSVSIRQVFSDVLGGQPCSRQHCLCCANPKEKKDNCFKSSVLFEFLCYSCLKLRTQNNEINEVTADNNGADEAKSEGGDRGK